MKYEIPNNGYLETCNRLNCDPDQSFGMHYSLPYSEAKGIIKDHPQFTARFVRPLIGTDYAVRSNEIQAALDEANTKGDIALFAFGSGPRIKASPVDGLVSELRVWFKK